MERVASVIMVCTEKLTLFAQNIGLVFQIIDDILDVTSTDEELGKNIGSDKESNKTTFMSFFTPEEAKKYATALTDEAIARLEGIRCGFKQTSCPDQLAMALRSRPLEDK